MVSSTSVVHLVPMCRLTEIMVAVGVGLSLSLGRAADQALTAVFGNATTEGGSGAFCIRYDHGFTVFDGGHATVCCSRSIPITLLIVFTSFKDGDATVVIVIVVVSKVDAHLSRGGRASSSSDSTPFLVASVSG